MNAENLNFITALAGFIILFSFSAFMYISQNKKYSQK